VELRVLSLLSGVEDGTPRSHDEVARRFGVSSERIREIENLGKRKLRDE
jgi:DNA-directed RNA polymerase sigma subunit (sigma70/sigma32)